MIKNESKQIEKIEKEKFVLRPINIKQDYDELVPFYDQIFEKELSAKGISIRSFLDEYKRMIPFFKIMGLFSKNFRHVFDGFVYENEQGKIISTVNIGYSGNYWEIGMVATNHEYRRKGLAKKLILKSLEHAKSNNAKKCVLEVLEENYPAYNLYEKLGFIHFDTRMKLKLEKEQLKPTYDYDLPKGYVIQPRTYNKKTGRAMYELEEKATPQAVLDFLPVNKMKYQKTFLMRLMRLLFKLIVGSKATRWVVYNENNLIGILFIEMGKSEEDCHNIELIVDPNHNEKIIYQLINFALNNINNKAKFKLNIITIIRKSDNNQLIQLEKNAFKVFETNHILGIKIS